MGGRILGVGNCFGVMVCTGSCEFVKTWFFELFQIFCHSSQYHVSIIERLFQNKKINPDHQFYTYNN